MSRGRAHWRVRLSSAAERDFEDIIRWTVRRYGRRQARTYARTLTKAFEELASGPAVPGVKSREEISAGLFTLHVARRGRKGRHFVLFRAGRDGGRTVIDVLRVLHDAMDLARHVPTES